MDTQDVPSIAIQAAIEIKNRRNGVKGLMICSQGVIEIMRKYVNFNARNPFEGISPEANLVIRFLCIRMIFKKAIKEPPVMIVKYLSCRKVANWLEAHIQNIERILDGKGNLRQGLRFCIALNEAASLYQKRYYQPLKRNYTSVRSLAA